MAPTRSQPPRQQQAVTNTSYTANARSQDALSDFQARRLQRRLDELERTNPTDIPASSFVSQPQGVKPTEPAGAKKKQTGNVRRILYAKNSLKDWLDELPAEPKPPYYTAVVDPPTQPPRRICSSCGYTGAYKCPKCAEWSCDRNCMEVHERDGGCGVGG